MQPYFFPYLGYFQLIHSVDKFIFYDDVNFIKGGWINRNLLYNNNKAGYFTLRLSNPSPNRKINSIEILDNIDTLRKTLIQTYRKAPFFEIGLSIFEKSIYSGKKRISEINIESIINIANYLELPILFYRSSEYCKELNDLMGENRIISICSEFKADQYINMINGKSLYNKENFRKRGIDLLFLEPVLVPYKQYDQNFKSGLSVIDALMFNSPQEMQRLISSYKVLKNA